jgi:DNA-binding NarL/FixJ family response regulator
MVHGLNAQPDLEVVGEFDSCKDAVASVMKSPPDAIVFELTLGGGHTLDAIERCRKAAPETAKVIVGDSRDPQLIRRLIDAGARGYVFRSAGGKTLAEAVRYAVEERIYVCPCIASVLITPQTAPEKPSDLASLTQREFVVFAMLGSPRTKSEIAAELGISVRTLDAHTEHLKAKLTIAHTTDLRAFARQRMQGGTVGNPPARNTKHLPISGPALNCVPSYGIRKRRLTNPPKSAI